MKWIFKSFFVIVFCLFVIILCRQAPKSNAEMLNELLTVNKDATILVTDSGLGGLSIAADLAHRLPQSGVFRKARIVFFSALFKEKSGYNSLKNEADKVRIFDIVLKAMEKKYNPDLLLIGCNTLSVVYNQTSFAEKPNFPVVGIVEKGVDMIAQQFDKTPDAIALLFATRTTIGSNAHKNKLVERGFSAEQIIGQACHKLAGAINRGYDSEETVGLVWGFVDEALSKLPKPAPSIFVSLNCTDYGYSIDQFKDVFAEKGYPEVPFIDPNPHMVDFMFESRYLNRFPKTQVEIEVISKTVFTEEMIHSVGALLKKISLETAEALKNYHYVPDLFNPKIKGTDFTHEDPIPTPGRAADKRVS